MTASSTSAAAMLAAVGLTLLFAVCNDCRVRTKPTVGSPSKLAAAPSIDEIIDPMLTTSRVFVALAARSLAAIDVEVTLPQYRVLIVLAAHGPQNLGALSEFLGVSASTATRMCDRLVRKRLVRRRTAVRDRREVRIALTEAGKELINEATRLRRIALGNLLRSVPAEEQRALVRALSYLNAAAGEVPDQDWASGWQ